MRVPSPLGENPRMLLDWAKQIRDLLAKLPEVFDPTPGTIRPWPGDPAALPPGWLPIDGRVLDPAIFPDLARVLGTRFRLGGDVATVVRLPANPVGLWPSMTWMIRT